MAFIRKSTIRILFCPITPYSGQKFFDIGGHGGFYTLKALLRHNFEKVAVFEPDQVNISQLRANLFLNGLCDSVCIHRLALSDKDGQEAFQRWDESNRGKSRLDTAGNTVVETKRFDHLYADNGQVSCFKIDVEGAELKVLEGMGQYLKNNACFLQIESYPDTLEALKSRLEKIGYLYDRSIDVDHYFYAQSLKEYF